MPDRSARSEGAARDALVVVASLLVAGVAGGVLWWLLVTPAEYTLTAQGGAMAENELGTRFDADAWFAVIGVLAGLVAGLWLSAWRTRDPLLTSGLLVIGSALAAAVMLLVGQLLGPGDPEAALRAADVGAKVPASLEVDTLTVTLGWPVGVLVGTLFVLLGRAPESSDRPDGGVHESTTGQSADR